MSCSNNCKLQCNDIGHNVVDAGFGDHISTKLSGPTIQNVVRQTEKHKIPKRNRKHFVLPNVLFIMHVIL